jgi:hypothetical protein
MLLFMQFHIGYGSGASKRNETQFYWIGFLPSYGRLVP